MSARHHETAMYSMGHLSKRAKEQPDSMAEMETCKIVSHGPIAKQSAHQLLGQLQSGTLNPNDVGTMSSLMSATGGSPKGIRGGSANFAPTMSASGSQSARTPSNDYYGRVGNGSGTHTTTGGYANGLYDLRPKSGNNSHSKSTPQTARSPALQGLTLPQIPNPQKEATKQLYRLRGADVANDPVTSGATARIEVQSILTERNRQRFTTAVKDMELNKKVKPPAPMSLSELEEQAMKNIPNQAKRLRAGAADKGSKDGLNRSGESEEQQIEQDPLPFVVNDLTEHMVKANLLGEVARTDLMVSSKRLRLKEETSLSAEAARRRKSSTLVPQKPKSMRDHGKKESDENAQSQKLGLLTLRAPGEKDAPADATAGPIVSARKSVVTIDIPMLEVTQTIDPMSDPEMGDSTRSTPRALGPLSTPPGAKDPDLEGKCTSGAAGASGTFARTGSFGKSLTKTNSTRSIKGVLVEPAEPSMDKKALTARLGLGSDAKASGYGRKKSTVFLLRDEGHMVQPPMKHTSSLLLGDASDDEEEFEEEDPTAGDSSGNEKEGTFLTGQAEVEQKRKKSILSRKKSMSRRASAIPRPPLDGTVSNFEHSQTSATGGVGFDASSHHSGGGGGGEVLTPRKARMPELSPEDFIRLRGEDRHAQKYRKGRYVEPTREPVNSHTHEEVKRFLAGLKLRTHEFNETAMEELDRVRDAQVKFRQQKIAGFDRALNDPNLTRAPAGKLLADVRDTLAASCRKKDHAGRLNVFREHIDRLEVLAEEDFPDDEHTQIAIGFLDAVRLKVAERDGKQTLDDFSKLCAQHFPPEMYLLLTVQNFLSNVAPMFGIEAAVYNHWLDERKKRFEQRDMATIFRETELKLGRDQTTEIRFKLVVHSAKGVNTQSATTAGTATQAKPAVFVKITAETTSYITRASHSVIPKWNESFQIHMFNDQVPVQFKLFVGEEEVGVGYMSPARFKEQSEQLMSKQATQQSIANLATSGAALGGVSPSASPTHKNKMKSGGVNSSRMTPTSGANNLPSPTSQGAGDANGNNNNAVVHVVKGPPQKSSVALAGATVQSAEVIITVEIQKKITTM